MGITRDTSASKNTAVPSKLMALCKEFHGKGVGWECLARAGRHGYKHCGLRITTLTDQVDYTHGEVARALMAMMQEHQDARGEDAPSGYRVDVLDDREERLNGDGDFIRFADGEAEDEGVRDKGTWALKALEQTHNRYVALLDRFEAAMQVGTDSLAAMTQVVAESLAVQQDVAEKRMESEDSERKHQRNMKLLDFLMEQSGSSTAGAKGETPLLDLFRELPKDVDAKLRSIIGDDDYNAIRNTAANPDRAARSEALMVLMQRLQKDPKVVAGLSSDIPEEWNKKFRAAIMAEIRAGAQQ